ncbi:MAG: hypothetical protein ABUL73_01215 [Alphaproteobacteria bacterium]
MFNISLERRGRVVDAEGEIVIGEFRESFLIDLSHWSAEQYRDSWRRCAGAVLSKGFARFLTSIGAPGVGLYETWPCWRRGGDVVLLKGYVLSSVTRDYKRAEEAETLESSAPAPEQVRYRCTLTDMAAFERRLIGAAQQ